MIIILGLLVLSLSGFSALTGDPESEDDCRISRPEEGLEKEWREPGNDAEAGRNANSPPRLFWTLEENYENNGVHPTSGISTDTFLFRIMYFDDEDDDPRAAPGFIHLVLDGINHTMDTVDAYFPDGSIFVCNLTGLNTTEHTYYFECSDGGSIVSFPSGSRMDLPVINTRPELLVPRLPSPGGNSNAGTVFPVVANSTDPFTFQVLYRDIDGHPPSSRKDSRGIYIDNVFYKMDPQEGVGQYYDNNYQNGEIFEVRAHLPTGDLHSYYFEFEDEMGAIGYTETFEGPVVVEGFPDIRVVWENKEPAITGAPSEPDPDSWDEVVITAGIENPSDFSVNEAFRVSFEIFHANRLSGVYTPAVTLLEWVDHLYDHSSTYVSTSFNARDMGRYRVVVTVDSDNDILEIVDNNDTKTNNAATRFFTVGPDLSIVSDDILPAAGFAGTVFPVTARIFNTGPTDAVFNSQRPLEVLISIGGEPYLSYVGRTIPAGGYADVVVEEYRHRTPEVLAIAVKVDEKNDLAEAAENGTFDNNNVDYKELRIVERLGDTASPSFCPGMFSLIFMLFLIALITAFRKVWT